MTDTSKSLRTKTNPALLQIFETLQHRRDFLKLRSGAFCRSKSFVLQARDRTASSEPESGNLPRLGFTVTKQNGNAVVRNRIKRRLREAARAGFAGTALENHDYAIIAKRSALSTEFGALVTEIGHALSKVHGKPRPTNRNKQSA